MTISLAGLGDRARREINEELDMRITSKQKKFALPMATFFISLTLYILTLGGWFCFLMVVPMTASAMVFCHHNWDWMAGKLNGWLDRDGWK